MSNYPATSIGREGDPICDCYRVNTYQNSLITVLCDGCGWGEKSKQAALRVSTNVTKHLSLSMSKIHRILVIFLIYEDIPNFKNTKEIAHQLVHAFAIANYSIRYASDLCCRLSHLATMSKTRSVPGQQLLLLAFAWKPRRYLNLIDRF